MRKILELREKRAKAIADARGIQDKADTEERALTAEELGQYEGFCGEAETLKTDIDRREALEVEERALLASADRRPAPRGDVEHDDDEGQETPGRPTSRDE